MSRNSELSQAIPTIVVPGDKIVFGTGQDVKVIEIVGDRMRVNITGDFTIDRISKRKRNESN